MQIADWAHTAYEAACRRDQEGVIASITQIMSEGPEAVQCVSRNWVGRTITVLRLCGFDGSERLRLMMLAEADDEPVGGAARPLPQAPAMVQWIGDLLVARANCDETRWQRAWRATGTGGDEVAFRLNTLVWTMAMTATRYAEEHDDQHACRCSVVSHHMSPMVVAGRIAVSHLN